MATCSAESGATFPDKVFSHLSRHGAARMVDVGGKRVTAREAVAFGEIRIHPKLFRLLKAGTVPKGDVFSTARLAGIMAAKKTSELIPLCHVLPLDRVEVSFLLEPAKVVVRARVKSTGKTGVEMEALMAAAISLLTFYDMCKSVDKEMEIVSVYLAAKSGGRAGAYKRQGVPADWLGGENGKGSKWR